MRAGDYAALRAMLGYPAVTLEPGQYLIHCMSYLDGLLTGYDRPITVAGQTLKPGGVRSGELHPVPLGRQRPGLRPGGAADWPEARPSATASMPP